MELMTQAVKENITLVYAKWFSIIVTHLMICLFVVTSKMSKAEAQPCRKVVASFLDVKAQPTAPYKFGIAAELAIPTHVVVSFLDFNPAIEKVILQAVQFLPKNVVPIFIGQTGENALSLQKALSIRSDAIVIKVKSGRSFWARDFVPELVQTPKGPQWVGFRYNRGDRLAEEILSSFAKKFKYPAMRLNFFFEGGNIVTDQKGNLYLSERVIENNSPAALTSVKRDYDADLGDSLSLRTIAKRDIERQLKSSLQPRKIIWLPDLPREVEPTGHIDMYIKIFENGQAVVAKATEPKVKSILDHIAEVLESEGLVVHRLQIKMKDNIFYSAINSLYLGDGNILIPEFGFKEFDARNLKFYRSLGLNPTAINGNTMPWGGSIHCLTKQLY